MKRSVLAPVGLVVLGLVVVGLSGCAPGDNPLAQTASPEGELAGFWLGLWHGLIVPITFVVSLFADGVGVYEVHNSGAWYDFGFVLGLMTCSGSGCKGGHSAYRRRDG